MNNNCLLPILIVILLFACCGRGNNGIGVFSGGNGCGCQGGCQGGFY